MFREMLRIKQKLSDSECIEILKNEPRGVLSVIGDEDYPYAMPMNYFYDENSNKIYFHCGKRGHRMDSVKKHDKVSFCVYDKGYRKEGDWALNIKSVIIFGRIRVVEDWPLELMWAMSRKYTNDDKYIENEIQKFAKNTAVLELEIEHMSGKLVNES